MKYIKKFETGSGVIYDKPKIVGWDDNCGLEKPKKYIIYGREDLYISQVKSLYGMNLTIIPLYKYSESKLIKINNPSSLNATYDNMTKILFMSDDLQECLDMLPIIVNKRKYNL